MKDFHLLGMKVKDKVSGLEGVVTSISYNLYGCIQGLVQPPTKENGEMAERWWMDTKRLDPLGDRLYRSLTSVRMKMCPAERICHYLKTIKKEQRYD